MLRDNHAVVEDLNLYQELNDQAADQITGGRWGATTVAGFQPLPGGGLDVTPNPGETATCFNVPGIGVVCNVTRQ